MAPTARNLIGLTFNRLTVTHELPRAEHGSRRWGCRCECGATVEVFQSNLTRGITKSCGCFRRERAARMNLTHGESGSPEFIAWQNIIARCENPNAEQFPNYGARGIAMCQRWRESFAAFLADMGARPSDKHTIDRFPDNDGNYEPGNCRWATWTEQQRNRRDNVRIEVDGVERCVSEWSEVTGLGVTAIHERLRRGWSPHEAVTRPLVVP